MVDLTEENFDKFVRVLAQFSVAGFVVHLTARPGTVKNESGAETVARMLRDAGLPQELMGPVESKRLLRHGGRGRFELAWNEAIKQAVAPLPPELQMQALEQFTATRAWRQAVY